MIVLEFYNDIHTWHGLDVFLASWLSAGIFDLVYSMTGEQSICGCKTTLIRYLFFETLNSKWITIMMESASHNTLGWKMAGLMAVIPKAYRSGTQRSGTGSQKCQLLVDLHGRTLVLQKNKKGCTRLFLLDWLFTHLPWPLLFTD